MSKSRKILLSLVLVLGLGFALYHGADALAQSVNTGLQFGEQTGLSAQSPKVTIVKVIRIGLGFLGIIAVGLIMYAGFLWMSAKGNEEKVEQAKKILTGAAIGFAIILASFGIASFILSRLLGATGGNGVSGGVCSPACSSGQYCCNGGCQSAPCSIYSGGNIFAIQSSVPAHHSVNVPRNAVIRVQFTKNVKAGSVTKRSFVVSRAGEKGLTGDRATIGSVVEFVPGAACDAPNQALKCFPKNETISVEIKNEGTVGSPSGAAEGLAFALTEGDKTGVISVNGEKLSCSGSSRCIFEFTTGDYIDTDAPRVNLTTLQVCVSADNTLQASAIDNYGVGKIDFYAADQLIGSQINNSLPFVPSPYSASITWNPGAATVGQTIALKATAYDLDSNSASVQKSLKLVEAHCCNGLQDGNETGVDCGGGCLACIGQACTAPTEPPTCSSDMCQSGLCSAAAGGKTGCLCQTHPKINWITPAGGFCANDINKSCSQNADCGGNAQCDLGTPNGASGNLITISGEGFGAIPGKVFFSGSGNSRIEAKLANDSEGGNPKCGDKVWTATEIIAIVPAGAAAGPISVEAKDGTSDSTNDGFGALINDFKKNTISRPGLCLLNPYTGKIQDIVNYSGVKLAASKAYFGNLSQNVEGLASNFPKPDEGSAGVPSLTPGRTTTYVINNRIGSNYLAFVKDNEPYDGPIISAIDPASGPIGQYVTIRGSGFGGTRGTSKVYFGDITGTQADYNFPDICTASVWNDRQIIVKVPAGIAVGSYKLTVARNGYAPVDSGTSLFQVTTGSPAPGLCRVDPSLGQPNAAVTMWGEYFQAKNNNSAVIFYNNQPQRGQAITQWEIDQSAQGLRPWKVLTTVPQSAATGPVRISVGAPAQLSNGVNFSVGTCAQDADCGSGATCCGAGLPEAGKCKSDSAQCYGNIATSVYEWQFSTGTTGPECAFDQEVCGTACCANGCENPAISKCVGECAAGQNQCGNGDCCSLSCIGGPNGGASYCPDPPSCSGYNNNQCVEGYICPNSPGQCSPTPATATCDCCCDKTKTDPKTGQNPGCCAGLTCGGSCGSGPDLGVCTGCAVNGVPDDTKCNCEGTTGKFCAINAQNPGGFCTDCSSITDPVECSAHTQCCVDAKNGNKCTSVVFGQPRVPGTAGGGNETPTLGGNVFAGLGQDSSGNKNNATGDSNAGASGNGDAPGAPGGGSATLQFCGYFSCAVVGGQNACAGLPFKTGTYKLLTACVEGCVTEAISCSPNKDTCENASCPDKMHCDMSSCECKNDTNPPQDACKNPLTQQCNDRCGLGYQCLTPYATGAGGSETADNTCRCCCKPPAPGEADTCKQINPALSCLANQDACTGTNRGACCGCSADAQCGDVALTGCGQTGSRCCRARPMIGNLDNTPPRYPEPDATNVCRNPAIEAFFNQKMDLDSFGGNVTLIGDYEGSPCPNNYEPVTMAEPVGRLAKLLLPIKKVVARIAPVLMTKDALADASNYCIIAGTPIGADISTAQSKVNYRLTRPLDANRKYYVVVQGDPALAEVNPAQLKDYYDDKITSLSKIGFSAIGLRRLPGYIPSSFNTTKFANADVWTFKTGNDICTVDRVSVNPSFHLFQKPGEAEAITLTATPISRGQRIDIIPGFYDWAWSWESANSDVVNVAQIGSLAQAKATPGNKKDAQTIAKATATITADTVIRPSTVGKKTQGTSQLRLFLCENPWPLYYAFMPPPGFVWPWKDEGTGIEFYYCRDFNGIGTSDDLPALKESPLAQDGGRRICMYGNNKGKTCTGDANCENIASSCWPEVLKEYFFFRETTPVVPTLSGVTDPNGNKVTLRWQPTANADKYKIYYGTNPRQYGTTIEVPGSGSEIAKTIDGLVNNINYYFAVTALSGKNQETAFSNEVKLKPKDTIAPEKPSVVASGDASGGSNKINLFWEPVPGAASYIAYMGARPRTGDEQYANSQPVSSAPSANQPNATFTNLTAGTTYYFAVKAVDAYGNKSDYSSEIQARPNTPYLISAVPQRSGVRLRWAPFVGGQGYVITVGSTDAGREIPPISVGASSLEYVVSGLPGGEYSFTITAKKSGGQLSDVSNQLNVRF